MHVRMLKPCDRIGANVCRILGQAKAKRGLQMMAMATTLHSYAPLFRSILPNHSCNRSLCGSFLIPANDRINLFFYPFASTAFCSISHKIISSSEPNKSSIQEFLQKSCGLPQKPAILAAKSLLHLKSVRKPKQVVKLFKEHGFSDAHIRSIIIRLPRVLASSVHRTLLPKLRLLEDVGIVGDMLGELISIDPAFFKLSAEGKILRGISFLQTVLKTNENVVRVLTKQPRILHFDIEKKVKPKLLFLKTYGIDKKYIWNYFITKPRFLMSSESVIRDWVKTAVELGVPQHSGLFVHAVFAVSTMTKETLERKMSFFMSLGLSKEELLTAIRKSPYILMVSAEKFQNNMHFLVNTLKYEPSVIVHNPTFVMWSMEARIMPRYRVFQLLQSMQLPEKIPKSLQMFNISEKRFLQRYVFPYGESAGLYEIYKGTDM